MTAARAAFEARYEKNPQWLERDKHGYLDHDVENEWIAWLAGYRAGVEAAAQLCITDGVLYDGTNCADMIIRALLPGAE